MHNELIHFGGTANPELTTSIARELGIEPGACEVERFPDGEPTVRLLQSVRDREVYVVQPTSPAAARRRSRLAGRRTRPDGY